MDGVEDLNKLSAVDVVLLELRLPGLDGLAFWNAIDDSPPGTIVSALDPFDKRVARWRLGPNVVALLQKPLVPTELLDAVAPVSGEEWRR